MKILVTGTAGFIGYHVTKKLVEIGHDVIGLDIINDYYDVKIKYGRLDILGFNKDEIAENKLMESNKYKKLKFIKADISDKDILFSIVKNENIERICHLAAQAGVRYSLTNPEVYLQSNLVGFLNILEVARYNSLEHLVYASSSSVYGLNQNLPFSVHDNVDHPISLYAASKKSNELMAHTYSHLFNLPTTGLRFFTVYGPWGRPDMALFLFTKAILEDKPINVFNNGQMKRDFTYIDDIVESIVRVIKRIPKGDSDWDAMNPDPSTAKSPYRVYNIGNNNPVKLLDFIDSIEKILGKTADKNLLPMQPGDVAATWADVEDLMTDIDFKPETPIAMGIEKFISWYREFFNV